MSAPADDDAIALAHRMFDLARTGDQQLLAYLDSGVPAGLTDATGNSLLMLAAYHGHAGLVTGLAARGAEVDAINDRGQTPLAGAVFKASPDVVRALLAAGADPDLGSPSARESAVFFEQSELAALWEG
ncbi:MAG: ankyrin repeat domain-containing protein [Jatrophihabitans sp.]